MNWKNPATELPQDGETIWVLDQHWKKNGILSCRIMGAVARHLKTEFVDRIIAENSDDVGAGWLTLVLRDFKGDKVETGDAATAWCPLEEIPLPGFLEHRRKST